MNKTYLTVSMKSVRVDTDIFSLGFSFLRSAYELPHASEQSGRREKMRWRTYGIFTEGKNEMISDEKTSGFLSTPWISVNILFRGTRKSGCRWGASWAYAIRSFPRVLTLQSTHISSATRNAFRNDFYYLEIEFLVTFFP